MVLQRDKEVSIWGFAAAGEKIEITLNDEHYSALTGKEGKWRTTLSPHKAGGPYEITLKRKTNTVVLKIYYLVMYGYAGGSLICNLLLINQDLNYRIPQKLITKIFVCLRLQLIWTMCPKTILPGVPGKLLQQKV